MATQPITPNKSDLINRINALLQVTVERGATENESAIAATKINELLIKYNLDLAKVQLATNETPEMDMGIPHVVNKNGKRVWYNHEKPMPESMHNLAQAIGELYFCECIGHATMIYLGSKNDVELAAYTFETLIQKIHTQAGVEFAKWKKEKFGGRIPLSQMYGEYHPRVWQSSWVEGACDGLAYKIFRQVWARRVDTKATAETTALVVSKGAMARAYAETKYPVWYGLKESPKADDGTKTDERRAKQNGRKRFNSDAWGRGHKAGETMQPTPGVNAGSGTKAIKG